MSSRPLPRSLERNPAVLTLACALCLLLIPAVLALIPGTAGAQPPQIRINSDTTQELQNEQQVCLNPVDPLNVVACWRDFRLGYRQVGVGYSLDGGYTWTDYLIGGSLPWDSDPVLIVHDDGTFYLVVINYQNGGDNQLAVHRSTNKGITWEGPFTAVYSNGATFEDKEWIAVDRNGGATDGRLAISWSRFNDVKIMCVTSSDRAETWTAPVQVSAPGAFGQWPVPIFLRNGSLLVAWDDYGADQILYDISTNGGASWGTDRQLTATGTSAGDQINGGITVFPYPALVMDESGGPRDGTVYCMYADRAISSNGMDIWIRRSTDHGNTWGSPTRVNDDPTGLNRDQFHPWVACGDDGALVASWYDRREDPSNYLWHIYGSVSTDGGQSWWENYRITDVPSSPGDAAVPGGGSSGEIERVPPVESADDLSGRAGETNASLAAASEGRSELVPLEHQRAGLIGEYSGISARQGQIVAVWTDTRNGHQDTYGTVTGYIADAPEPVAGRRLLSLTAWPNPSTGGAEIHLRTAEARGDVRVTVADASGRLVRSLEVGAVAAGETIIPFDGRDASGQVLPGGVYWARLDGGPTTKLVILP